MTNTSNIIVYDFGFRGDLARQSTTKYVNKPDYATQVVVVLRLCDDDGNVIKDDLSGNIACNLIDYYDKEIISTQGDTANWNLTENPLPKFNKVDYSYSCIWSIYAVSQTPKPITMGYEIILDGGNYSGDAKNTSSDGSQNPITLTLVS
ncbi:hypothetical protein [Brucella pseudogrignonensis]|uniref:Uncharacterized protein n=1 Tax=Brucella pseudogrignonensis TaxID=419475 RepID=A0ABU1MB80_9HYPH|nr:hypothetical protein [Brucella pseudogrignonensis]MDR6433173.1 hypothetical protein [Brucella pseudogrignonensis]